MAFVPLFCQSHYSPLGVSSCEELVERARSLGYSTLGLCDDTTMAGFHDFDEACRANGVRPVFGVRLTAEGVMSPDRTYPLDFLIEGEQGYRNLVRILTQHQQPEGPARRLPRLQGRTAGLRVVVPADGELPELIRSRDKERIEEYLQKVLELFAYGVAFGIGPETEAEVAMMTRRLAAFMKFPSIAAPRIHFADPSAHPAFLFLSQSAGAPERGYKPLEDPKVLPALFAEADWIARFGENEDAAHESGEIARRCAWRPTVNRRIIPSPDFERGFDGNSFLFDLTIRGASERYGEIKEEIKQRINREFEEVKTRDLASYLLLHRQIIGYLDEQGISRGVGRGSAIASVIAYCLGITRIDPLQYHLAYQTLASDEETYPPIRIEIPSGAVPKLLAWLRTTYGEEHLAQIGRRQEARREVLIDELAEWAGMTAEECRLAHKEKSRARGGAAQKLREIAEEGRWKRWRDPAFIADLASRLSGRPRALIAAPGRWTLSAEALEYVIPTIASDESRVTDIGEEAIDRLGGPRLEFVSHLLLNLLDRARLAAAESSPAMSVSKIPLDDRATFDMLARGDTIGIPPLEGITVKSLLRKHRPSNILQLLRVKTEANHGRANEKSRDLIDELPDVLISYQCAYFKANHAEAYFAGALSSVAESGENVSVLVRAARRAGIEILPPDINLSSSVSAVHAGKIRLGLRMVRQFGEKAWEDVQRVRRGGRFNSLMELCEGVSPRIINHRVLQNLIGAGAFDGFGRTRAQMSATIAELQKKSRAAVEPAAAEQSPQFTLFDLSSIEEKEKEAELETAPEEEWNAETTLRREREALGFNVALDPMSRFPMTLAALKPLSPEQVSQRFAGRRVRIAGLIDHTDEDGPLVEFEGARLADLEGVPVWVSPTLSRLCSRALEPGTETLVIGDVTVDRGYLRVDAHGLWRMEDLEDQAARVARIQIDLSGENRVTLKHLISLVREYRGTSAIEPVNYNSSWGWNYRRLARQRVFFCSPFFQGLCKILPTERVALFDDQGRPLRIALPDNGNGDK